MTKTEAQAWRDRWTAVNKFQEAEQRASTVEQRWNTMQAAYRLAQNAGLPVHERDGSERVVWERWMQLRTLHRHGA